MTIELQNMADFRGFVDPRRPSENEKEVPEEDFAVGTKNGGNLGFFKRASGRLY